LGLRLATRVLIEREELSDPHRVRARLRLGSQPVAEVTLQFEMAVDETLEDVPESAGASTGLAIPVEEFELPEPGLYFMDLFIDGEEEPTCSIGFHAHLEIVPQPVEGAETTPGPHGNGT